MNLKKIPQLCKLIISSTFFLFILSISITNIFADDTYRAGLSAYNDEMYDVAITHFVEYIKSNPDASNKGKTLILLTECYFKNDNYKKAIETASKINDEGLIDAKIYWTAKSFKSQQKFTQALDLFDKFLNEYGQSEYISYAYYDIANIYYKLQNYQMCVSIVSEFIKKEPTDKIVPKAIIIGVKSLIMLNHLDRGESWVRKLLQLTRNRKVRTEAYYLLGIIYEHLGILSTSSKYLYRAAKKNDLPEKVRQKVLYKVANAYWESKNFDRSVYWFGLFIYKFPDSPLLPYAILRLSESHLALKHFRSAAHYLEAALKKYPDHPEKLFINFLLAESLLYLGELGTAEKLYEKIISQKDNKELLDKTYFSLGILYEKQNNFDKSKKYFKKCLSETKIKKLEIECRIHISKIMAKTSEYQKAIDSYMSMLEDYT